MGNKQWSKEPPTDEGHYRVYLDGAKDPTVALVYFLDGEILIDVPGIREGIGPGRVKRWGPMVEFHELEAMKCCGNCAHFDQNAFKEQCDDSDENATPLGNGLCSNWKPRKGE